MHVNKMMAQRFKIDAAPVGLRIRQQFFHHFLNGGKRVIARRSEWCGGRTAVLMRVFGGACGYRERGSEADQ
jgi:hypothetical protein